MTHRPTHRALWFAVLVTAWLGAMAWLVFQEAYPGLLNRPTPGYRSLLARGVMVMDRWMIVSFQNRPIGYTHTSVDVNEKDPAGLYRIKNQTFLTLTVMGNRQRLSVHADAVTDSYYALQSFRFSLAAAGFSAVITGARTQGEMFDLSIRGAGPPQHLSVTIPDDAVIYSPLTEMALKSLSPGQRISLKVFNPLSMASQTVTVRALRRETLRRKDKAIDTVVLSARMEGMDTLSWVDREGVLIRQETPIGLTMESCEAREALSLKSTGEAGDLLKLMNGIGTLNGKATP